MAERLLKRLHSNIIEWQEAHLKVTASIGISCCSGELSPDELIALADRALYRAKAHGRNCFDCEDFNSASVAGTITSSGELLNSKASTVPQ